MFYDNFINFCNKKGVAPSRAAVDIGGSKSDVTRWKQGSRPTDAKLSKLADYFGVAVSDLIGTKKPASQTGSGTYDEVIKIASVLSPEQLEKYLAYGQGMIDAGE